MRVLICIMATGTCYMATLISKLCRWIWFWKEILIPLKQLLGFHCQKHTKEFQENFTMLMNRYLLKELKNLLFSLALPTDQIVLKNGISTHTSKNSILPSLHYSSTAED